jgi:hypothetical protein
MQPRFADHKPDQEGQAQSPARRPARTGTSKSTRFSIQPDARIRPVSGASPPRSGRSVPSESTVASRHRLGDRTSLPGAYDACRQRASALRRQELRLVAIAAVALQGRRGRSNRQADPDVVPLKRSSVAEAARELAGGPQGKAVARPVPDPRGHPNKINFADAVETMPRACVSLSSLTERGGGTSHR